VKFLLPTGIGDSVWALTKIQAIRDKLDSGGVIDVSLVGSKDKVDSRALDFVRRFRFVNSVDMKPFSIQAYGPRVHPDGTYNYVEDGMYEFDGEKYCVLIPNAPLEKGIRLENWLPQYQINWNIFRDFHIETIERIHAADVHQKIGDYAVFYPGPLAGNTVEGHNRGPIWTPQEWVELGKRVHDEFGLHILVVGASYDLAYFTGILEPLLKGQDWWTSVIGRTNLGELWAITDRAKFVISYQAGVGIISALRGTPTGIWWRPEGNSISSSMYLSFSEKMASAWASPTILESETYMPMVYTRHDVSLIMEEVRRRGWHETPIHSTAVPAG
jgi:hypothetical protein